tara:strand:+ start:67321 stop:67719 length:399 start_codon:yes stop_codon:yes gene_type:complete
MAKIDVINSEGVYAIVDSLRFTDDKHRKNIFSLFYQPLAEKQQFSLELNGTIDLRVTDTGNKTKISRELTLDHVQKYVALLTEKINNYNSIIARNKSICNSYEEPTIDPETASEFAQDALLESFKLTRSSYK